MNKLATDLSIRSPLQNLTKCAGLSRKCAFFYWDFHLIFISAQKNFMRQQEKQPKENNVLLCTTVFNLFILYLKEGEN